MLTLLTREELAWAAGFYDGEGCTILTLAGSRYCHLGKVRPRMTISQNHPEVLEHFQRAVGGLGSITGPHFTKNRKNPQYRWTVSGAIRVQAIFAMMYPWLGTLKKEQASRVLEGAHWERPQGRKRVS